MCPLYPLHIVVLYLCLILPLLLAVVQGSEEISSSLISGNPLKTSRLVFHPEELKTQEQNISEIQVSCYDCNFDSADRLVLQVLDPDIASVSSDQQIAQHDGKELVVDLQAFGEAGNWSTMFNITGEFLGFTKVHAKVMASNVTLTEASQPVAVIRKKTIQSKLFAYSVATLVSLAYINMGCAMDLQVVKETLKRPIGPLIGIVCQYIAMPLIAFGLGFIFYQDAPMRLGLFVTGCSPGGGASNIWTVMFGGNLDLSVTMTAISTFAAFFMMPAWIFSLGQHLILDDDETQIVIPYYKIVIYAFFLVVPLGIGLLTARYLPRVSAFLVRILKPISLFLILFILIFGIWANLYIFRLMNWQVFVVGMGLPWIGFAFGCTLARALNQSRQDIIAIAIETGIQNTGMSIFILWFTLDHPLGDITGKIHRFFNYISRLISSLSSIFRDVNHYPCLTSLPVN